MKQEKQEKNNKLIDLFVGPLGKAQLDALKFSANLALVDTKLEMIKKMESLNVMLENRENMTEFEIDLAEKLLDEIGVLKEMKNRFTKYLTAQYENLSDKDLTLRIKDTVDRVAQISAFSKQVLDEVTTEMVQEGFSKAQILAHLSMLDLEERT